MSNQKRCEDCERGLSPACYRIPRRLFRDWLGFALCTLLAVGCDGGSGSDVPKTVPVSGVVTYNGQPLTHGEVVFTPKDTKIGRSSRGEIGPGGKYSLTTFREGDGVVPGDFSIAVFCYEDPPPPTSEELANPPAAFGLRGKPAIPTRYLDPKTSGLTATVSESANVVDLKLTD